MATNSLQKYDCDRSGFTHRKSQLIRQRGLLVAPDEVDDLSRIQSPNPRWRNPRENSTTTTAVNTPNVFTITESGVTALQQSREYRHDGVRQHYHMHVVANMAPTTVTGNPRIVDGSDGDRLTLYGRSRTSYLILNDGNGISLIRSEPMFVKHESAITFVYDATDDIWRETSRTNEIYIWDEISVSVEAPSGGLLLEDGTALLGENGLPILLEG